MRLSVASSLAASLFIARICVAAPTAPANYQLTNAAAGLPAGTAHRFSQLIFKPGDPYHLYASRGMDNVVTRYDYNPTTRVLSNPFNVVDLNSLATDTMKAITGIGFHGNDLWITRWPGWVSDRPAAISRMYNPDSNGKFQNRQDVVTGIQLGNHTINQIQIVGNTLYTSIGMRTNRGNPAVEDIYNGTVVRIGDISDPAVMNLTNTTDRATFLNTGISDGHLRKYAGGFRNAYGLRMKDGKLWVADNGADNETGFNETHDLFYRDVRLNDNGQFPPGAQSPAIPIFVDIGSHKAPAGFDFIPTGPDRNRVLVALSANNTSGRQLITVDTRDGDINEFMSGFTTATDVVTDSFGNLLISDWDADAIYVLTPPMDADVNFDRKVDIRDMRALLSGWGKSGTWATGDFDGSGFVDRGDLSLLARNWQKGVSGGGSAASFDDALALSGFSQLIPEPGTGFVALTLFSLALKSRRRELTPASRANRSRQ